ncbi:hypothetical protein BANRA_05404 [Pseudomonas aeruginosa]|nr:hypothetical protein BANRA_05404 [Pseudomonas aeruginosa]
MIGGASLAQGIQAGQQAFLRGALLGELATEAGDDGGLLGIVLQGGLELVLCARRAGLLGLELLVGAPEQQGQGAEQGEAVQSLAQRAQAALSLMASLCRA